MTTFGLSLWPTSICLVCIFELLSETLLTRTAAVNPKTNLGNVCSPSLKHNHFICRQVWQLQFFALFNNIGMFANHQPTNVGEEEPPSGIVGVCVCLGVLVVDTVVPRPLIYVILFIKRQAEIERITWGTDTYTWEFQGVSDHQIKVRDNSGNNKTINAYHSDCAILLKSSYALIWKVYYCHLLLLVNAVTSKCDEY